MKKQTTGDIVRYLYREMTATGAKAFEKALEQDPELKEELEQMKNTVSMLDSVHSSPNQAVLARIMDHASAPCKATEQD